ncbi:MAG: SPFH domain-containing protein [Chloroflexota bacterium]|nr:SPFH domain-containing protein [Chloroflexota bacterium]
MSSEWTDPGAPEQEQVTKQIWQDQDFDDDLLSDQQPDVSYPGAPAQVLEEQEETEDDDLDEAYTSKLESFLMLGRQVSPLVAPLLFGGLTFLLTFLPVLQGRAYLSPVGLLPVVLVLVAIAFIYSIMLYYAGANNVLWSLAMIGGFLLFVLAGCFTVFGPLASLILLIGFCLLAFLLVRLYFHPVPEGEAHIVYSVGKYSRTLFPGPNFRLPWESVVEKLDTREVHWSCPPQTMHISRTEDVYLAATIAYQLLPEDAHLVIIQVHNWQETLHKLFVATIQAVVSNFTPNDFMAWSQDAHTQLVADFSSRWDEVNSELVQRMQDHVASWGVQINWVRIHDVTVTPRLPNIVDLDTMETPPIVEQKEKPAGARVSQKPAPVSPEQAPPAPVQPMPQAGAARPAATPPVRKIPRQDVLERTYEAVRQGNITDPETIRGIAARFEAIAHDPEASKAINFDAGRAAQTLYQRAELLSSQQQSPQPEAKTFSGYSDKTQQHPWPPHRSTDD